MLSVEGRPPGDRANRGFATIQMAETKVFAIPDFAHRNSEQGQPQHVIYDWKTGNPREQDEFQLGVYVFFAMEKWGAKPEDVLAVDAYLTRGEFKSLRFSSERMAGIRDRLEGSLAEMRSLHFDADESMGDPEDFPLIADSSAAECTGCNYRELCGR
jgi:CRISPR/Cas system-associated exonuclease Cas4 (RecB family)